MYEPEWPVPPVTQTRMLPAPVIEVAREVVVRVRSGGSVDAAGEVEAPRAMAAPADHHRTRSFQPAHHSRATDAHLRRVTLAQEECGLLAPVRVGRCDAGTGPAPLGPRSPDPTQPPDPAPPR